MNLTAQRLVNLFQSFETQKVMVIGDVMLDSYIWGHVDRISPEAPVPVVLVEKREDRLGGAANVGLNLKALGAETIMCSVVGKDANGEHLRRLMQNAGLNDAGLIESQHRHTTTKFRILGNNTQMLRVDDETIRMLDIDVFDLLCKRIESLLDTNAINVIVFQDYDKGVISPALIDFVVEQANRRNIPITVDPKKLNFQAYHHITLMKPNLLELKEGLYLDRLPDDEERLRQAADQLIDEQNASIVLSTLSEKGVFVCWKEKGEKKSKLIPAHFRNIADVSGAGDTVISVASLCLANGLAPEETAALSNLAGGQVCEQVGVVPIDKDQLLREALRLLITE